MILTYAVIICDMFENCKERCFAKRNTFCSNHINDMQNRRKGCILSTNKDDQDLYMNCRYITNNLLIALNQVERSWNCIARIWLTKHEKKVSMFFGILECPHGMRRLSYHFVGQYRQSSLILSDVNRKCNCCHILALYLWRWSLVCAYKDVTQWPELSHHV